MLSKLLGTFRPFVIVFAFVLFVSNTSFAAVSLSNEEKEVFKLSYSLGESSYLMPDLISNEKIMGIAIVHSKLIYLQRQAIQQHNYVVALGLDKKVVALSDKYQKEIQQSLVNSQYDRKKLIQSQKTYVSYSALIREETSKLYGQKITWLFDVGFLTGFTNVSMQSEYQNKLVLLQFKYLMDYIPYDLPSSIESALSNIVNQQDATLTASEIDLLKESAKNIAIFFNNPAAYSPPATIKNIVGVWEGRLAEPGGSFHKASLKVFPDLTAELSVDGLFKSMPVNEIKLAQSIVSFDIKPFGEDRLKIKFSGRLVDDMMAGDAVDISGKTGKWQFLRTSKKEKTSFDNVEVVTDNDALDKIAGVWKGKILETNGAISSCTLYFNLIDDSKLEVDNGTYVQDLIIKDIAVNNEAIKFIIAPKDNDDLLITFLGKVDGGVIEGNAVASDGTRGYWKLLKLDNKEKSSINIFENLNLPLVAYSNLCDPLINDNTFEDIVFVSNEKEAIPRDIEYKGYIVFPDGYKAGLTMFVSGRESKLLLSSDNSTSKMLLVPKDLKITPRDITFTTFLDEKNETEVVFTGKIFGDYISGFAQNASGNKLKWELVAVNKAKQLLGKTNDSDITSIYGLWSGDANIQSFLRQPAEFYFSKGSSSIKLSDKEPVDIRDVNLDGNNVSFILPPNNYSKEFFVFNGTVDQKRLTGVLTSTSGLGFDFDLKLVKPLNQNNLSGIWIGDLHSGSAVADIIFDFSSNKKKIYVDDSSAVSGRVELLLSDLKNTGNKVSFTAKPKNSPMGVKFEGNVVDQNISGFAFNDLQPSNKLTWSASKSSLLEYLPDKIEAELSKKSSGNANKKSFSFLDQLEDKNDKIQDSVNSSKSDNNKKPEVADNDVKKVDLSEDPISITDKDKYKKSEIEKAIKQMKVLEDKPEKLYKKDISGSENKEKLEQEKVKPEEPVSKTVEKVKVTPDKPVTLEKQEPVKEEEVEVVVEEPVKETDIEVKPEEFYGKWVGQLDNPEKGKGEIILDIKSEESYMYVDKFGEKVPFKLFDLKFDNKRISFMIKPSLESDFGIKFDGSLIQGVLSGDAFDPAGSKGKWFAKKP